MLDADCVTRWCALVAVNRRRQWYAALYCSVLLLAVGNVSSQEVRVLFRHSGGTRTRIVFSPTRTSRSRSPGRLRHPLALPGLLCPSPVSIGLGFGFDRWATSSARVDTQSRTSRPRRAWTSARMSHLAPSPVQAGRQAGRQLPTVCCLSTDSVCKRALTRADSPFLLVVPLLRSFRPELSPVLVVLLLLLLLSPCQFSIGFCWFDWFRAPWTGRTRGCCTSRARCRPSSTPSRSSTISSSSEWNSVAMLLLPLLLMMGDGGGIGHLLLVGYGDAVGFPLRLLVLVLPGAAVAATAVTGLRHGHRRSMRPTSPRRALSENSYPTTCRLDNFIYDRWQSLPPKRNNGGTRGGGDRNGGGGGRYWWKVTTQFWRFLVISSIRQGHDLMLSGRFVFLTAEQLSCC